MNYAAIRQGSQTLRSHGLRAIVLCLFAATGCAADLRVITSGAFTAVFREVVPDFERVSGHHVQAEFGASTGRSPTSIPNRLRRGETFDAVILAASGLEQLIHDGKVTPSSRVDLVRSRIGVAVREGAPKPEISTIQDLARALLQAKSVGYSESISGVYVSTEMLQKLGIADQVLPKCKRFDMVGPAVARGEVEIGIQQVSELLPVKGISYIGPLPDAIQKVTVFAAGIPIGSREPEAAKALLRYLSSKVVAETISKSGLEAIASR